MIIYNLCSYLLGYNLNYIQDFAGIYSLDEGLNYYGEIHKSSLNKIIHGLFMPLTVYGILLWFPALLNLNISDASKFRGCVYYFYLGLYFKINIYYALIYSVIYYFPLKFANIDYRNTYYTLINGLVISFYSLFIQEIVGHYLGGDEPSRIEGLINAVLYAPYFGLRELVQLENWVEKQSHTYLNHSDHNFGGF